MGERRPEAPEKATRPFLTGPPFYLPEFEESYGYIIDEYDIGPRDIAIFIPCAVRKPYSQSPSHQLIRMIISQVLEPSQYHIVVFGTCGIVPAELEEMYPYAHYRYMLGKCQDESVKEDFLRIETERVAGYLEKTRHTYTYRIADLYRALPRGAGPGVKESRGRYRSPPSQPGHDQPDHRGGGVRVPGGQPLHGRVPGGVLRRAHPFRNDHYGMGK